jgi:hypothetical protein
MSSDSERTASIRIDQDVEGDAPEVESRTSAPKKVSCMDELGKIVDAVVRFDHASRQAYIHEFCACLYSLPGVVMIGATEIAAHFDSRKIEHAMPRRREDYAELLRAFFGNREVLDSIAQRVGKVQIFVRLPDIEGLTLPPNFVCRKRLPSFAASTSKGTSDIPLVSPSVRARLIELDREKDRDPRGIKKAVVRLLTRISNDHPAAKPAELHKLFVETVKQLAADNDALRAENVRLCALLDSSKPT